MDYGIQAIEIDLVYDHQDRQACAQAEWKRLAAPFTSGVYQIKIGCTWAMDFQEPYAKNSIGGFDGEFPCVECTTGYVMVQPVVPFTAYIPNSIGGFDGEFPCV